MNFIKIYKNNLASTHGDDQEKILPMDKIFLRELKFL